MNRLGQQISWTIKRWSSYFGWPGAIGLGLLVFSISFYFSAVLPAHKHLEELDNNIAEMRGSVKSADQDVIPDRPETQLLAFYRFFADHQDIPDLLEQIYEHASAIGLRLDRGEYRVISDKTGKLLRYQITLPVKGTYPQIRGFVANILKDIPTLSLDNINFKKQKITDPTVDSEIKLSLYLGEL